MGNTPHHMQRCVSYALAMLLLGSACSAKDAYESGHALRRSKADCEALTSVDEREQCERNFDMDFEAYQRERQQP